MTYYKELIVAKSIFSEFLQTKTNNQIHMLLKFMNVKRHEIFIIKTVIISTCSTSNFQDLDEKLLLAKTQYLDYIKNIRVIYDVVLIIN